MPGVEIKPRLIWIRQKRECEFTVEASNDYGFAIGKNQAGSMRCPRERRQRLEGDAKILRHLCGVQKSILAVVPARYHEAHVGPEGPGPVHTAREGALWDQMQP